MKKLFLGILTLAVAALCFCQELMPPSLIVKDQAYSVMPGVPVVLPPGKVRDVFWSTQNTHIIFAMEERDLSARDMLLATGTVSNGAASGAKRTIFVYEVNSAKLTKLPDTLGPYDHYEEVRYWKSSNNLTLVKFAQTNEGSETSVFSFSLTTGKRVANLIAYPISYGERSFLAWLSESEIVSYDPQLKIMKRWPVAPDIRDSWIPDGYIGGSERIAMRTHSGGVNVYRELLPNGLLGEEIQEEDLTRLQEIERQEKPYEASYDEFAWPLQQGGERLRLVPLNDNWVRAGDPTEAIIATDVSKHYDSPDKSQILYIHRGIPIFVKVVRVDVKDVRRALKEQLVQGTLWDAKKAGLAILMYSTDNDDLLPPNDSTFFDRVAPFVADKSILKRFIYTYTGNLNSAEVEDASSTVLGHIDGPGGRAVVYVDGHAKWIPD